MRHVLRTPRNMARRGRRYRNWVLVENVLDDRDVVNRQIPDHIDVVLEQAQARADSVIVIDVAEHPVADQLANLSNSGSIEEGVIHQQNQVSTYRLFNQDQRLFWRKTDSNSPSLREGKGCGQPLQASIAVSDLNL